MAERHLQVDEKRSGVFIHSEDENAPFVVGVLWVDARLGVLAEFPYMEYGTDQFATPRRWFSRPEQETPTNLLFRSQDLFVSLFGCRLSSASWGSHLQIGRLRAREAVFAERWGDIDEPLLASVFRSQMDGLQDWADLSSIDWESEPVDARRQRGRRRWRYMVERRDGLTWFQGEARMKLSTQLRSESGDNRPGIHIGDAVVLESKFRTPRPIDDHLAEHQKFRDFLTLNVGEGVWFREHYIRDSRFAARTLDGKVHGADYERIIVSETASDHQQAERNRRDFYWPILPARTMMASTLSRWSAEFDHSRRLILPAARVMQRASHFAEDIVVNASMSVEAIGSATGAMAGEEPTLHRGRPTTATHYYRLISFVGLDVSELSNSVADVASALADVYNTIKHADRGDFPEGICAIYAGRMALLLARLALMKRLQPDAPDVANFVDSWIGKKLVGDMRADGLSVDAPGRFVI